MSNDPAPKPISILPGVNVVLFGPAGTGKTHSIGTLVETGINVFYLGLEPGLESLLGYFTDKGKPIPPNLHWHLIEAQKANFTDLIANATKVNTMSLETLSKMTDPNKSKYNQFIMILEALNNFPDDRTGEKFGPTDSWDADRALVMDGMAGLGRAALGLVVGGKAVRNQSDWGIAQLQIETLLQMMTVQLKCHFILLAHVERETDAVLGGVKLTLSTLGNKLAPKIMPMFSDCILAVREGQKFTWSTGSALADTKTRNLPIAENITPTFKTIIDKWQSRGGAK